SKPHSAENIARLGAIASATRSLSAIITLGVDLAHALSAPLSDSDAENTPPVPTLVARLHARGPARQGLHGSADELHDPPAHPGAAVVVPRVERHGSRHARALPDHAPTLCDAAPSSARSDRDRPDARSAPH
ncbi:hypothetical protein, partial [Clavibacter michiganensis]|uniref:hypothetical protein n=1 Tax=Clavibacter michiganensis TaxID=28447 RepID=UPI00374E03A6